MRNVILRNLNKDKRVLLMIRAVKNTLKKYMKLFTSYTSI